MVKSLSAVGMAVMLSGLMACQSTPAPMDKSQATHHTDQNAQSRRFILYIDNNQKQPILTAIKNRGDVILYEYQNFHALAIKIDDKHDVADSTHFYQHLTGVLQITPDQVHTLHSPW